MEDGKGTLIAYHMLESSICAYIELLVNEPMWLLIKIKSKDARLVMLLANITHKPDSLAYPWSLFFPLIGYVLLSTIEYSGFYFPLFACDRWMLELTLVCEFLLVGSERISFTLRS